MSVAADEDDCNSSSLSGNIYPIPLRILVSLLATYHQAQALELGNQQQNHSISDMCPVVWKWNLELINKKSGFKIFSRPSTRLKTFTLPINMQRRNQYTGCMQVTPLLQIMTVQHTWPQTIDESTHIKSHYTSTIGSSSLFFQS